MCPQLTLTIYVCIVFDDNPFTGFISITNLNLNLKTENYIYLQCITCTTTKTTTCILAITTSNLVEIRIPPSMY